MGTAATLLAFLISHGSTLVSAGLSLSGLVSDAMSLFKTAHDNGDITADQFNDFVDKCLGNSADLDAIINKAKADMASSAA